MENKTNQADSNNTKEKKHNGLFGKCQEMMNQFMREDSKCNMGDCMSFFSEKMKGQKQDPDSKESSNNCCG